MGIVCFVEMFGSEDVQTEEGGKMFTILIYYYLIFVNAKE
jgi:hypothetical protein